MSKQAGIRRLRGQISWEDYFRGISNRQTVILDRLLGVQPLAIGDLILTEVLQRIPDDRMFRRTVSLLGELELVELGGKEIALQAARNHRLLRGFGVTARKTIDTIIATRCIIDGYELLHNDRDFRPFVQHFGLRVVT